MKATPRIETVLQERPGVFTKAQVQEALFWKSLSQLAKEQLESDEKPSSELKLRLWIWSVPYSGWMDNDVL